jgi:protein SCO1/2
MNMKIKICGFFFLILFIVGCRPAHEFAGVELSAPHPAPDTTLQSVNGPVSLHDFHGKYTFVYFGYTFCPDVCPTSMSILKRVKEGLGENADEIAVVMITVDPERDTPEKLAQYMNYFDSSFVGLSADSETIDEVGEPFGLYYAKHEGSAASGYLIDHTARIYLLDPDANAIVAYPHNTQSDFILNDLEYLMENDS